MEKYPPKYNLKSLKEETAEIKNTFERTEIDMYKDKPIIEKVKLLLMVVTDSEFHATLLYLSKSKETQQCVLPAKNRHYFIGSWGKISAALVKQDTEGIETARKLTCSSIRIFKNLKAIISLGVCGLLSTKMKLADVIVPTKITGYRIIYKDKNLTFSPFDIKCGQNILHFLNDKKSSWSFSSANKSSVKTPKESTSKHEEYEVKAISTEIVSGHLKMEDSKLKGKLNRDIAGSRMAGIEMEGMGIWEGIEIEEKEIEFLVVKAGSDYANETKTTQWQAFSSKAAASFVYTQLKSAKAIEWFQAGKILPACILYLLQYCTTLTNNVDLLRISYLSRHTVVCCAAQDAGMPHCKCIY